MNGTRRASLVLLVAVALWLPRPAANGCACCSEEGQYSLREDNASDLQIEEMSHIKFAATAQLYVGAGDKEDVKGIRDPSYSYSVDAAFDHPTAEWKLTVRDENGDTGAVTLPVKGARVTNFSTDIHDGEKSAGGGPLLYKEWKFRGRARGDGIFASGFSAPASYTLILQGRGNNCDTASDFSHWRLEIRGSKADFVFVGELVIADVDQPESEPNATPAN